MKKSHVQKLTDKSSVNPLTDDSSVNGIKKYVWFSKGESGGSDEEDAGLWQMAADEFDL